MTELTGSDERTAAERAQTTASMSTNHVCPPGV